MSFVSVDKLWLEAKLDEITSMRAKNAALRDEIDEWCTGERRVFWRVTLLGLKWSDRVASLADARRRRREWLHFWLDLPHSKPIPGSAVKIFRVTVRPKSKKGGAM